MNVPMKQLALTLRENHYFLSAVLLCAWFLSFQTGFITAVEIWRISDIFNHCFLVLPLSAYFIYQKREQLSEHCFTPNYWLFPLFIGCLFVQAFGEVGDIQLFMHIATFTSLPILIWMFIGNKAARVILFPLVMILFAIPVGEQLTPFLQELTTDLAVPLLELTQVPIYRNGLYLDIPEGRFLVAEACSGVSFLIASIVFGCIYAYVSFSTLKKQAIFVLVSIGVPVLANALRVYGIILTGHLSDMEYAVGADHLIYGGVFYAIIIFILVVIGESFRDVMKKPNHVQKPAQVKRLKSINIKLVILVLGIFVAQFWWLKSLKSSNQDHTINVVINTQAFDLKPYKINAPWIPEFKYATEMEAGRFIYQNRNVDFFIAAYHSRDFSGELISSLNRLYSSDRWTLVKNETQYFSGLNNTISLAHVISPLGEERVIAHWYDISGRTFTSKVKAKLYETGLKVIGVDDVNKLVALSIEKPDKAFDEKAFLNQVFINFQEPLGRLTDKNE